MTAKDLKNALLQEAVQGKLVPQIASEGNARDLLEEIRKERGKSLPLAPARKRSSVTPSAGSNAARNARFAPITEDEIPFEIPESWCWCRLGELGLYRKGPFGSSLTKSMFVPKSDDSIKVYEQKNAIKKDFSLGEYYISKEKFETMQSFIVEPSDIIVSCAGTIGEVYKLPPEAPIGIINQALMRVKLFNDNLSSFWMMYFDYVLKKEAAKQGSGTAIKNIPPFEILKAYPFPLPPLAEQKRIVSALEKFMPLIEEYGKKETELKAFNEQIGTLTKKAILQEAVQGKLVPQIAAEGNAKDLLEEIKKEKAKLIKEGKIKKETPLSEISEDEIPFDIPENWCWCRLGEIGDWKAGSTPSRSNPELYNGNIPWLKTGDLTDGDINEIPECISKKALESCSMRLNPIGSVLIAMYGATIGKLGILKIEATTNQACCACVPYNGIYNKYLFYYLMSQKKDFTEKAEGGAQPNISREKLVVHLLPLPPYEEQKRIVAAIEKMLSLCEKLGE